MDELFGGLIIFVGGTITAVSLLTTLLYLLPERIQKARQIMKATPRRAFGIGLVNSLFFGLIAAMLMNGGELLQLFGLLIALTLLGLGTIGLAAIVALMRKRIFGNLSDAEALKGNLKTAVLLIIAGFTPVIGWFILTPLAFITGLGAVIITLFNRQQTQSNPVPEDDLPY